MRCAAWPVLEPMSLEPRRSRNSKTVPSTHAGMGMIKKSKNVAVGFAKMLKAMTEFTAPEAPTPGRRPSSLAIDGAARICHLVADIWPSPPATLAATYMATKRVTPSAATAGEPRNANCNTHRLHSKDTPKTALLWGEDADMYRCQHCCRPQSFCKALPAAFSLTPCFPANALETHA